MQRCGRNAGGTRRCRTVRTCANRWTARDRRAFGKPPVGSSSLPFGSEILRESAAFGRAELPRVALCSSCAATGPRIVCSRPNAGTWSTRSRSSTLDRGARRREGRRWAADGDGQCLLLRRDLRRASSRDQWSRRTGRGSALFSSCLSCERLSISGDCLVNGAVPREMGDSLACSNSHLVPGGVHLEEKALEGGDVAVVEQVPGFTGAYEHRSGPSPRADHRCAVAECLDNDKTVTLIGRRDDDHVAFGICGGELLRRQWADEVPRVDGRVGPEPQIRRPRRRLAEWANEYERQLGQRPFSAEFRGGSDKRPLALMRILSADVEDNELCIEPMLAAERPTRRNVLED